MTLPPKAGSAGRIYRSIHLTPQPPRAADERKRRSERIRNQHGLHALFSPLKRETFTLPEKLSSRKLWVMQEPAYER